MDRQYEDPYKLEEQLEELKEELNKAYKLGADDYELMDLEINIAELKDRITFAWQDDEYDSMY